MATASKRRVWPAAASSRFRIIRAILLSAARVPAAMTARAEAAVLSAAAAKKGTQILYD
jgi:hypothetical protein